MIDFDIFGFYKKVKAATNRPTLFTPLIKDTWECQCCRRMKHANSDRFKHEGEVICGTCASRR